MTHLVKIDRGETFDITGFESLFPQHNEGEYTPFILEQDFINLPTFMKMSRIKCLNLPVFDSWVDDEHYLLRIATFCGTFCGAIWSWTSYDRLMAMTPDEFTQYFKDFDLDALDSSTPNYPRTKNPGVANPHAYKEIGRASNWLKIGIRLT
jgi:hypothetical protein